MKRSAHFLACFRLQTTSGDARRASERGTHRNPRWLTLAHQRAPRLIPELIRSGIGPNPWRRRRDSNPRYAFGAYNGLANRRLQPLGHVSASVIQALSKSLQRPKPKIGTGLAPNFSDSFVPCLRERTNSDGNQRQQPRAISHRT